MTDTPRKRATHGGPRPGSGRKPLHGEAQDRYTIRLPADYAEALRRHGSGNLAHGVRRLIEDYLHPAK